MPQGEGKGVQRGARCVSLTAPNRGSSHATLYCKAPTGLPVCTVMGTELQTQTALCCAVCYRLGSPP